MFRTFVMAAAIITLPVLSPSVLLGQQAPPSTQGQHRTLPRPTNLQVLPKDISTEDLLKVMHGFTQQLGVRCTFCHAEDATTHHPDFASDAKPQKNSARIMMRMTHEINTKYLAQIQDPDAMPEMKTVSCGTCHRGHSMPEIFTPPEQHEAPAKS
ncbi:MAG TPA: c-type cytochrome [Acidobacteriaceae bacterium]